MTHFEIKANGESKGLFLVMICGSQSVSQCSLILQMKQPSSLDILVKRTQWIIFLQKLADLQKKIDRRSIESTNNKTMEEFKVSDHFLGLHWYKDTF